MTPELRAFVQNYSHLSQEALAGFTGRFQRRFLAKGTLLLHPGDVCHELLFVQSGCLRLFYQAPDGSEVSVWFAFPGYLTTELTSFLSGQPAGYAIEALADSELLYLAKSTLLELYEVHPGLHDLMRQMWEYVILTINRRYHSLQQDSAEQRYRALLQQQPVYLQQIPQKYLASYLGVTPSSLSRIRRKLAGKYYLS